MKDKAANVQSDGSNSMELRVQGLLLGTAVADSIGLPTEGMKPAKIAKRGWDKALQHRFLGNVGMWSDDTEQTILLAQSLVRSKGDISKFTKSFAWDLRCWLLMLPAATGLATARAITKLWLGVSSSRSGVFSAGNGSAMRTAPIAAFFPHDKAARYEFTKAQTQMTHSDPKAFYATLAVTEIAALFLSDKEPDEVIDLLLTLPSDNEWKDILLLTKQHLSEGKDFETFLSEIGGQPQKGISGYVYQTVPAVIFLGEQNNWDYKDTISACIRCGGDTDTVAAIAGALCGAKAGIDGIPDQWIKGLKEWPQNKESLNQLARSLVSGLPSVVRPRLSPLQLLRNAFFLLVVLGHGLTRVIW